MCNRCMDFITLLNSTYPPQYIITTWLAHQKYLLWTALNYHEALQRAKNWSLYFNFNEHLHALIQPVVSVCTYKYHWQLHVCRWHQKDWILPRVSIYIASCCQMTTLHYGVICAPRSTVTYYNILCHHVESWPNLVELLACTVYSYQYIEAVATTCYQQNNIIWMFKGSGIIHACSISSIATDHNNISYSI